MPISLNQDALKLFRTALENWHAQEHSIPSKQPGRCIVTLGGGAKYFICAYVLVRMLRELGCKLPIEWWYIDDLEMDAVAKRIASELPGVELRSIKEATGTVLGGWQSKIFAIMHARHEEVLFLDADQVPISDPTYLFDEPSYKKTGAMFWPDFAPMGWDVTREAFEIMSLPVPGSTERPGWHNPTDYKPFESGQLLIHTTRTVREISLTALLNVHSDLWYPQPGGRWSWLIYGDKSTFYLAWEHLKREYAMPDGCLFLGSDTGGCFVQRDMSGMPIFQHRCQPVEKWHLHGENVHPPGFIHANKCERYLMDLRKRFSGQMHSWDPDNRFNDLAPVGRWYWYHGDDVTDLEFMPRGKFNGLHTHRWSMHHSEPYVIVSNRSRTLAVMGEDDYGNWCNHDTGDFLMRAPPRGFEIPKGKHEVNLWSEVVHDNEYRLPEKMSGTVLDIGAHVGCFAYTALQRGVERLHCVEAHPDNYRSLCRNFNNDKRVTPLHCAAWATAGVVRLEMKPASEHTGGWSALGTANGVVVPSLPLDYLICMCDGPISLLKIDCEGAEWPCLWSLPEGAFKWVEAWCGEYHCGNMPEAMREQWTLAAMGDLFRARGYEFYSDTHKSAVGLGHFWAWRKGADCPFRLDLRR